MHDENGMSETRVEACFVLVIYNYLMLSVHPRSKFTYIHAAFPAAAAHLGGSVGVHA
jgi:hypothetical protein